MQKMKWSKIWSKSSTFSRWNTFLGHAMYMIKTFQRDFQIFSRISYFLSQNLVIFFQKFFKNMLSFQKILLQNIQ